jgi:hypothetical protein
MPVLITIERGGNGLTTRSRTQVATSVAATTIAHSARRREPEAFDGAIRSPARACIKTAVGPDVDAARAGCKCSP